MFMASKALGFRVYVGAKSKALGFSVVFSVQCLGFSACGLV